MFTTSTSYSLTASRHMPHSSALLYEAWTTGWGTWFAEPDSVRVQAVVGAPFYFDVLQRAQDATPVKRHPHYGRFLELVPHSRVALTWVTGGTAGAETTLSVTFTPDADGTLVALTHDGFTSETARDQHAAAWPMVLAQQELRVHETPTVESGVVAPTLMPVNRSIPASTFIPVRSYPDLDQAVVWLRDVLGCTERLRIPGHRVQLTLGNGAVVAVAWDQRSAPATGGRPPATLMVRVSDIDATYARALAHGATGIHEPLDQPYGERQAQVRDPAGHAWTLTQTIGDVDPASWGGVLVDS
jgi:uncharacterized glyoxalase superfamily protein PhnB/uncharacterized protein YndB with AHSA1/START domain